MDGGGGVEGLTGVRSRSTDRGTACSRPGDLGSGLRSIRSDICRSEVPPCCAGSSANGSQRSVTNQRTSEDESSTQEDQAERWRREKGSQPFHRPLKLIPDYRRAKS